jgi:hypothetical protein
MAIVVTHAKVATILDDGTSEVGSNEWNANHVVTGDSGDFMEVVNGGGFGPQFTIYVDAATGDEDNDGLTSGTALATIQNGVNKALYYSPRQGTLHTDHTPNIKLSVAAGEYSEAVTIAGTNGTLSIRGAGFDTSGTHTLLTDGGIVAYDGAQVWVDNIAIEPNGQTPCLQASNHATITAGWVEVHEEAFGMRYIGNGSSDTVAYAYSYGKINLYNLDPTGDSIGDETQVVGSWNRFARVQNYGQVFVQGAVTLSGSPSFADAFAVGDTNGLIEFGVLASFPGSAATGKRFEIFSGCRVKVPSGGLTFLPGDAAGTAVGHAVYDDRMYGATFAYAALSFATLPASPAAGMVAFVSDSTTATWGATIAGGGSNNVLAFYNGANWTVAGA